MAFMKQKSPQNKEIDPLLHHTLNLQSYNDDLPSFEIRNSGTPAGVSSDRKVRIQTKRRRRKQPAPAPPPKPASIDTTCAVCIGRLLVKLEQYQISSKLKKLYTVLLINAVIVCFLLILSRALDNEVFGSSFFRSDSPPLLLAANVIMMCSYSIENFLMLRVCLSIGCSCFALWGLTNDPMLLDTTMFNSVMLLLNLRHAVILSYRHRHIDFEDAWEQIYVNVFQGYLNRDDFSKLVEISYIRRTKKGEIFKTKGDEITSLCCLVKGRISVVREAELELDPGYEHAITHRLHKVASIPVVQSMIDAGRKKEFLEMVVEDDTDSDIERFLRNPHFVNLCHKNTFIEAPQWVAANLRPDGDRFTVSFVTVDDVEFIKWPRENLVTLIENNSNIYHALSGVLGMHTAHALLKSREYNKIQAELSITRTRRDSPKSGAEQNMENDGDIDEDEVMEMQEMNQ